MGRTANNKENPVERSQWMSAASTVILILLMFCYLVMNISNSTRLAEQTEVISNHPLKW